MGKDFAPRTSKRDRKQLEISNPVSRQLFRVNDEKLLKGAQLADIALSKITVRDQVRTKFDDDSLKELAENIRLNGLIQPLVLHRENDKFILLCGERRFRAMNLIGMAVAPCFILEGKTSKELMAIQFSENSSREELHYIDRADGIYNYQMASGASERQIQAALGISKSEVHRSLIIGKLPKEIKSAAKTYNIEKYVLVEFDSLDEYSPYRKELERGILLGQITKRSHIRLLKKASGPQISKTTLPKNLKRMVKQKKERQELLHFDQ